MFRTIDPDDFDTDGKQSSNSYIADGKERKLAEASGSGEVFARVHWKKAVLTIETTVRLKMPDQPEFNGSELLDTVEQWTIQAMGVC